jgi:hypothetical protein
MIPDFHALDTAFWQKFEWMSKVTSTGGLELLSGGNGTRGILYPRLLQLHIQKMDRGHKR